MAELGKMFGDSLGKAAAKAVRRPAADALAHAAEKQLAKTAGKESARKLGGAVARHAVKDAAKVFNADALVQTSAQLKKAAHGVTPTLEATAKRAAGHSNAALEKAAKRLAKSPSAAIEKATRHLATEPGTTVARTAQSLAPKETLASAPRRLMRAPSGEYVNKPALPLGKPHKPPVPTPPAPPSPPVFPVDGKLVDALPASTGTKPVTYVGYSASDNELGIDVPKHLNDLETAGSGPNVNVLIQTDRELTGDSRLYYITKDADPSKVNSVFVKPNAAGELNMADPASLQQTTALFNQYPSGLKWADHNDHGSPFAGVFVDQQQARPMPYPDVYKAMAAATPGGVDVISQDYCQGMSMENLYQARNITKFIVGSEDETFPMGMNTGRTLQQISDKPPTDALDLAKRIFSNAQMTGNDIIKAGDVDGVKRVYAESIADASKVPDLATAVDQLATSLSTALDTKRDQVMAALKGVKRYYVASNGGFDWNTRSLPNVANALKAGVDDPAVKTAADKVLATSIGPGGAIVQTAAVDEEAGAAAGLSIYLPLDGKIDPTYLGLDFAKDTHWMQFLQKLGAAPAADVPAVAAAPQVLDAVAGAIAKS